MANEQTPQGNELTSALLELNLLHNGSDINSSQFAGQSVLNSFRSTYIVPPNTPIKLPMQVNPKYITKIYSSPRRMPNRVPSMRMRPYYIPERPRTKSENSDPSSTVFQETRNIVDAINYSTMMDTCDNIISSELGGQPQAAPHDKYFKVRNKILFKKSKSLEDIRVENLNSTSACHEMEFIKNLQKLRVQD